MIFSRAADAINAERVSPLARAASSIAAGKVGNPNAPGVPGAIENADVMGHGYLLP
jgi:hypothetical protein